LESERWKAWSEYSRKDIANFWFPATRSQYRSAPCAIYSSQARATLRNCTRNAAPGRALCTFGEDSDSALFSALQTRSCRCFGRLEKHIRVNLETVVRNCISDSDARRRRLLYEGAVTDQRCVGTSRWVLASRSPIGEVELISVRRSSLSSARNYSLPDWVKRGRFPGLGMTHLTFQRRDPRPGGDSVIFPSTCRPCWAHTCEDAQSWEFLCAWRITRCKAWNSWCWAEDMAPDERRLDGITCRFNLIGEPRILLRISRSSSPLGTAFRGNRQAVSTQTRFASKLRDACK